jgi:hypothetical protein
MTKSSSYLDELPLAGLGVLVGKLMSTSFSGENSCDEMLSRLVK